MQKRFRGHQQRRKWLEVLRLARDKKAAEDARRVALVGAKQTRREIDGGGDAEAAAVAESDALAGKGLSKDAQFRARYHEVRGGDLLRTPTR